MTKNIFLAAILLAVVFSAPLHTHASPETAKKSLQIVPRKKGSLTVISGPMFGGKTEELMRQLRRFEFAKKKVLTIKHIFDNRIDVKVINSHAGRTRMATPASDAATIRAQITPDLDVVAIDEVQFFSPDTVDLIDELIDQGITVVVAGIDTTFRGESFGIMPELLTRADDVIKLKGICVKCGADARHTQRIINGKPAAWNSPLIMVGGEECYESRCRNCFEIEKPHDVVPVLNGDPQ